eukprot:9183199-Pyramimonas_sp.AAC.1
MRMSALSQEDAACVFFDFRAAFPSIDQSFMLELLAWIGLPPFLLRFVTGLYRDNMCQIVVAGHRFAGFALSAGVRQGCPLSPLLFAIVADLLLRRLQHLLPAA